MSLKFQNKQINIINHKRAQKKKMVKIKAENNFQKKILELIN